MSSIIVQGVGEFIVFSRDSGLCRFDWQTKLADNDRLKSPRAGSTKVPTVGNGLCAGFERTKRRVVDERLLRECVAERGGEYRGGLDASEDPEERVPPSPGGRESRTVVQVERRATSSRGYPSIG